MIVDPTERYIMSGRPVLGKYFWIYDTETDEEHLITTPFGDCSGVHYRKGMFFSVTSVSYNPYKLFISVHRFSHPDIAETYIEIAGDDGTFSYHGDLNLWVDIPRYYSVLMGSPDAYGFRALLSLAPEMKEISVSNFEWLEAEDDYDAEYMAPGAIVPLPQSHNLLVFIQRSDFFYVLNPVSNVIVLRGGLGFVPNHLVVSKNGRRLWIVNGSTISIFNLEEMSIVYQQSFTSDEVYGTSASITDLAVDPSETLCCVARIGPNEIIALDVARGISSSRTPIDFEPGEVSVFRDGRFFCREWKAGVLRGGVLNPPEY